MNIPTALEIFTSYIRIEDDNIDVSGLFGKECYQEWLSTRKRIPKRPAPAFRKVLTGHVRGDKGLSPFQPRVEAEVLKILREKKVWSCFEGTNIKIGLRGYQSTGYWESQTATKRKRPLENEVLPPAKRIYQPFVLPSIQELELNTLLLTMLYCQSLTMNV